MTTYYLITDANGYELTSGLSAADARRIAQVKADDRGEVVTVTPYHLEDSERIDHDADAYDVDPVSDEQIEALRNEAAAADDLVQVALCNVALATDLSEIPDIDESVRADLERLGIIPEHIGSDLRARAACVRAIRDAQAMAD